MLKTEEALGTGTDTANPQSTARRIVWNFDKFAKYTRENVTVRAPLALRDLSISCAHVYFTLCLNFSEFSLTGTTHTLHQKALSHTSGNKIQVVSPEAGVKSKMLLQLLLNTLKFAASNWPKRNPKYCCSARQYFSLQTFENRSISGKTRKFSSREREPHARKELTMAVFAQYIALWLMRCRRKIIVELTRWQMVRIF